MMPSKRKKKGKVTLVVAGPGTGKTTYITQKIQDLLEEGADPSSILALTFTEKAAQEMLERLDKAMPLGYEPPWISTFHGLGERILRENALEVGLDSSYKIITQPEAWILLKTHLFDLPLDYYRPLGNPTRFLSALLNFFSRAKDEEVEPEDYLAWAKKEKKKAKTKEEKQEAKRQMELAKVYQAYQDLLVEESYLDFGDLISWTNKLFKKRPNILDSYQKQFEHIFVDEFQDTNVSQFSLIKLLAPPENPGNLTVVGDDDQAIYKWRGASVSNILEFKDVYPQAQTEVLNTSYRLTDEVARASYELVQNNNPDRLEVRLDNVSKKLKTKKTGPPPSLLYSESSIQEAETILRKIVELVNSEGKEFRDFAILARANAHLDPFVAALKRHELPFQIVGNRGLFEQEEVAALLAVLRVIANPHDDISWFKVLHIPSFGYNASEVLDLLTRARKKSVPLVEILEEEGSSPFKLIRDLSKSSFKVAPSHLLFDFIQESGYASSFTSDPSLENRLKAENISLFFEKIQQFESEARNPTIPELVDWLDILIEAGESPSQAVVEDVDTINLMTVHAAKGLEFPVVFLVSLTSDRFPTRMRSDPIELPEHFVKEFEILKSKGEEEKEGKKDLREGHTQEERRLFYVGVTRSSERVFLSFAQNYGGVREKRPSRFIGELGVSVPEGPEKLEGNVAAQVKQARKKIKEEDLLKQLPKKFSYSQIQDYTICPWRYRYKYILKVPAPPTPPASFGVSVHEALREFEKRLLKGEDLDLKDLKNIYDAHFREEGYRDKKEKETYRKRGVEMIEDFYTKHRHNLLPPFMLEKGFEVKVGNFALTGRIDRIGKDEKGNFEIIDYKTSDVSTKSKEDLEKKAKRGDQLFLYSLAAKEALGMDPKTVGFLYLDSGEKVEVDFTPKQKEKRAKKIEEKLQSIKSGDFEATPGPQCTWCPFSKICPFSEADRYR